MRKGLIIILGMLLIGFLVYQTALKPVQKPDYSTVNQESVLNEVSLGDSVERVITYFGKNYDQEEQTLQLGQEEAQTYLIYIYADARIYSVKRLVKAVELTTPRYASPRSPKVGGTRADVESYYWRPAGATGTEPRYEFVFNAHLVFEFDESDQITRIMLY